MPDELKVVGNACRIWFLSGSPVTLLAKNLAAKSICRVLSSKPRPIHLIH